MKASFAFSAERRGKETLSAEPECNLQVLQHIQLIVLDLDYLAFDCSGLKLTALRQSLHDCADAIPHSARLPDGSDAQQGYLDFGYQWVRHLDLGLNERDLEHFIQTYDGNEHSLIEAGAGSLFPGVEALLQRCRKEQVAVALGADARRDYMVAVTERHQLESEFQMAMCKEEFGSGSTAEMLEEILHHAEANPSETLLLGTRPEHFDAAHQLGLLCIACGWGIANSRGFATADLQAETLSQLYPAILKADQLASQYA